MSIFTIEVTSAFIPNDWTAVIKMDGLNEEPIQVSAQGAEDLMLELVGKMRDMTARYYNGPSGIPGIAPALLYRDPKSSSDNITFEESGGEIAYQIHAEFCERRQEFHELGPQQQHLWETIAQTVLQAREEGRI